MTDASAPFRLTTRALVCIRADQPLFEAIDLQLASGELLLLEGDNGVGKTTLLRALLGLIALQYQQFEVHTGARLHRDGDAQLQLREQSRWLGHAPALKLSLSVAQNWQFLGALFQHALDRGAIESLADRLDLSGFEDATVASLSAGQRKRAQLAPLLLGTSSVWLLDEPFANLDRRGIHLIERLMRDYLAQGGAILASSHGVLPFSMRADVLRLRAAVLDV
jgi:heme exporter protein A